MSSQFVLKKEIEIKAPIETVWSCLTEPAELTKWQAQDVEIDPRVGGEYSFNVTGEHIACGQFTAWEPPTRLEYTWGWKDNEGVPPGSSKIEINLSEIPDGTKLAMKQTGLPDQSAVDSHNEGWTHYFGRLQIHAPGGDAGPDEWMSDDNQTGEE